MIEKVKDAPHAKRWGAAATSLTTGESHSTAKQSYASGWRLAARPAAMQKMSDLPHVQRSAGARTGDRWNCHCQGSRDGREAGQRGWACFDFEATFGPEFVKRSKDRDNASRCQDVLTRKIAISMVVLYARPILQVRLMSNTRYRSDNCTSLNVGRSLASAYEVCIPFPGV